MADVQFRFDNTVFGGSWDFTVPLVDMADFPDEQDIIFQRNVFRADTGTLYDYKKYSKKRRTINFAEVSNDTKGTMGSLALEDQSIQLHFGTDVTGTEGIVGTYKWVGKILKMQEIADSLWNFSFELEEV